MSYCLRSVETSHLEVFLLTSPTISSVTLDKLLNLSGPWFPQLYNANNNNNNMYFLEAFINSFAHPLIQQIFLDHLLCAKCYFSYSRNIAVNTTKSMPSWS